MKEKIKRISSSTWALLLALMMVVSSFSVLAATTNVEKTGSGYRAGDTIYFSAGSTSWYNSDARTVAYFYGNNDGCYAVFQSAGNDKNYLKATVPNGTFTTMTLIRYDPNNSNFNPNGGNGWPGDPGVWNKIENITRSDSSNNLYTVTSDSLNAGTWSKYDGGSTTTGHDVCMYGTLSNSFKWWTGFGEHWDDAPKFTYDADNKKYVLSNFTTDLSDFSFRVYDKTDNKHYCGSNKVTTTLSSGKQASMTTYDTNNNWDEGNTCFKYAGARGKKVNIEIPDNFRTIKVTEVQTTIADSVSLKLNNATDDKIDYGTNLSVTATLSNKNSSIDKVDYKFYLDDSKEPTATFTDVTDNSYTYTFSGLAEGEHTIKVEVSAEGYKSVTATTSITVKKHDIATSVSLEPLSQEVTYGADVKVTAVLNGKYEGYTGNVTYTLLDENGDAVSGVAPIETNQTNVVFTVTKPSTGHHTYKVSASAENYETVKSNTVSVYVKQTDITSNVTLTGPDTGWQYKVGDSIKLEASCENAPEGVTVKYNYYINGKKINDSATPNKVTYVFTASDVGTVKFYAEAVADNYNTVKSAEISASVIKKQVATSVNLTATPTNVKFGNEVTITATLTGDVQSGNFT